MENINHNIPGHDDSKKKKKDHYHDIHHFDCYGNHDSVKEEDFAWKKSIYSSKKNLTFKITLTGIFLALAIALSAFEMVTENLALISIYGTTIPFRILDLLVVTLSLSAIGPIFASMIGLIAPTIHLVHAHNPLNILIDSLGYFASVWIIWIAYYGIFKNSSIHRDPNIKKDKFKRWTPIAFYVPIMTVIYTGLVFASLYISSNNSQKNYLEVINYCGSNSAEWTTVVNNLGLFISVIISIELIRFSICYILFTIVELQMKKLNHRYQ